MKIRKKGGNGRSGDMLLVSPNIDKVRERYHAVIEKFPEDLVNVLFANDANPDVLKDLRDVASGLFQMVADLARDSVVATARKDKGKMEEISAMVPKALDSMIAMLMMSYAWGYKEGKGAASEDQENETV